MLVLRLIDAWGRVCVVLFWCYWNAAEKVSNNITLRGANKSVASRLLPMVSVFPHAMEMVLC